MDESEVKALQQSIFKRMFAQALLVAVLLAIFIENRSGLFSTALASFRISLAAPLLLLALVAPLGFFYLASKILAAVLARRYLKQKFP